VSTTAVCQKQPPPKLDVPTGVPTYTLFSKLLNVENLTKYKIE